MPSTRARVWVTSLTLAAVVMTLNGVPLPSQIRWCLLPVFPRSTGDGPVASPPFSRGCERHPGRPGSSPGRLQRAARRAGCDAASRRRRPSAIDPAGPPAGLPGATELQGQQLPADVVVEHVQDALQAQPVIHGLRIWWLLGPGRQQRLDQRPQVVVHDPRSVPHTSRTACYELLLIFAYGVDGCASHFRPVAVRNPVSSFGWYWMCRRPRRAV